MVRWLATWFGSGLSPVAPGTAGSLAALPFAWLLAWAGGAWTLLGATVMVFGVGVVVSEAYRQTAGRKDPSEVVIDEVAGQWLTLGLVLLVWPMDSLIVALSFLAFRIADITKPWPANAIDRRMDGGLGIMLDDMVAGLYAAGAVLITLIGLRNGIVAS
ncbi:phosphatidylglycerophosphatase A [uncultured Rhodospira sp.]|uniref:phosphatidylglycerophosphatase A family protein n=1 Tax=uncultured Rhodospira sp. TaxID=1936189 RepID=UPI0026290438|nr:phosphatidylglycerophosphatase A [uncultured Rhodospira sp.]